MKELVEVIAKSLVDYPDEVTVTKKCWFWNCMWPSLIWVR